VLRNFQFQKIVPAIFKAHFLSLLFFSLPIVASDYDVYVAPMGSLSIPFFKHENPQGGKLPSEPRIEYRVEAGKLTDNFSLDVRFGTRSYYTDFGLHFRLFDCFGYEAAVKLCYGGGFGAVYSPGFITEDPERNFTDTQVEPFIRFILDSKSNVGFIIEVSALAVLTRSYSTASPVEIDKRVKPSLKVGVGFLFDWEKVEDPFSSSIDSTDDLPEDYHAVILGVKGGLALTKFYSKSAGATGSFRGGALGGFGIDAGKGEWGAMIDVFYANRLVGSTASTSINLERIEIVPQLRFRTIGSGFVIGSLGMFAGIPISDAITTTVTSSGGFTDSTSPMNTDLGLQMGIGYGTRSKLVTMTMELRYGIGFVSLFEGQDTKSRPLDFLIGFLF